MQAVREQARHTAAVILGLWVLGVLALVLAEVLVPDGGVISALERGEDRLEIDEREQPYDNAGALVDEWSECVTLGIGLGEHRGMNVLESVATSPHLGPCRVMVEQLNPHDAEASAAEERSYLRYWHGSSVLTRPVLWIWGVAGLRAVLTLALGLAGAALFASVRRVADLRTATVALLPFAMITSVASLPGAANQAIAVAVGLASIAWVAVSPFTPGRVWQRSVVAGAAFSYVDLLTIVPGIWLLCAAVVGLGLFVDGASRARILAGSLGAGLAWMVGFAGMWVGKWVFASLVLGPRAVIDEVSHSIGFRLNGEFDEVDTAFGAGLDANLDRLLERPFVGTVLVAIAAMAVIVVLRRGAEEFVTRLLVAAPAVVPLVWFEILSNHSQIHDWFTYRSLAISLGVVLMAMVAPSPSRAPDARDESAARPVALGGSKPR